jgi:hypothetical protein
VRGFAAPVLTVLVFLASASASARADEAAVRVNLDRPSELPFSPEQLLAAVDARVPLARTPDAPAIDVRIGPAAESDRVRVASQTAAIDVPVAGKDALEAARLVALAVVDLTRAPPPDAATAVVVAAPSKAPANDNHASAARLASDQSAGHLSAALYPGFSVGLGGGSLNFEPTADLAWRLGAGRGPWAVGLSVGFARVSAPWKDTSFTLSTLPLRLGPRFRWRWVEVGAGGAARLYDTAGLDGGNGAMLGGYATIGAAGRLADHWQWTAIAGGDAYREKIIFRAAGQSVLTAGPLVFWVGLGARWTGGTS